MKEEKREKIRDYKLGKLRKKQRKCLRCCMEVKDKQNGGGRGCKMGKISCFFLSLFYLIKLKWGYTIFKKVKQRNGTKYKNTKNFQVLSSLGKTKFW